MDFPTIHMKETLRESWEKIVNKKNLYLFKYSECLYEKYSELLNSQELGSSDRSKRIRKDSFNTKLHLYALPDCLKYVSEITDVRN